MYPEKLTRRAAKNKGHTSFPLLPCSPSSLLSSLQVSLALDLGEHAPVLIVGGQPGTGLGWIVLPILTPCAFSSC